MKHKWTRHTTPTHTQHYLHTRSGYYLVSRPTGKSGYKRKGNFAGADWEVFFTDSFCQRHTRVGLITGLRRAKLFAEKLADTEPTPPPPFSF
mgnify:CR=1 FL=1